jgi:hypothetical protein
MFRKQFYFVVSGLKIIGHGNPGNNLESLCTCRPGELPDRCFACEQYSNTTICARLDVLN